MLPVSVYHPIWFYSIVISLSIAFCPLATYFSGKKGLQTCQLLLLFLALLIPCITALVMIYGSRNEALIADFVHRLFLFKISPMHLLFIVLLMPCVIYVSTGLSLLFGYSVEQFSLTKELSSMKGWAILGMLIPLVLAPLIEELGWRGYGVDSLRSQFNLFNTSVCFGCLWAVWHLPTFFMKVTYQSDLWRAGFVYVVNFGVSVFVIGFLMNWIYFKTDRSIPALVLFHSMLNLSSMILRTEQFTKCIATVVLCVMTGVVVMADKDYFFK